MDVQAFVDASIAKKKVDVHEVKQRVLDYIERGRTQCLNGDMLVIIPVVDASLANVIDTKVVLALLRRILKLG